jgi:beta-N-acetylhexosaminidase
VPEAEQAAAAAVFGGIKITGRLPVSASEAFPEGTGYIVRQPLRMGFALPEEVGMDRYVLGSIDSMAQHYVDRLAMPGCAVLVARQGKIVYEKGFGQTEYGRSGVAIDPLLHTYDLASVTKVAATTLCVMHLKEQGLLDLDEPIGTYLPWLTDTDKAKLTCRRLLQHNAGFPAFIAFQELTYMDAARRVPDPAYYSYKPDSLHNVAVSNGFYGSPALRELILRNIHDADLRNGDRVVYSDLGMILVGEIIHQIAGKPMDQCAAEWFYEPLGMNHSLFNPALSGQGDVCPPTESDTRWRNTVVRGYVHDPAAAMLGGVAGHAGLFSNITDLAKLLEMLRMGGVYGGESYFLPETIDQFTRKQHSDSRKGLGWDKPDMRSGDRSPVSRYASAETYGHTGFTGTCVWVDPVWDLTFIFLSNRTYPSVNNRILQREDVRSRILDKVYEAMFTYERSHPMLLPR